jgi:hypothetical protein
LQWPQRGEYAVNQVGSGGFSGCFQASKMAGNQQSRTKGRAIRERQKADNLNQLQNIGL